MSKQSRVCASATGSTIATDRDPEVIEYGGVLFRKPDFSKQNVDEILAWDKLRMMVKRRENAPPAPLLITHDHHKRMTAAASRGENKFGVPLPPRCSTAGPGRDLK